MDNQMKFRAKAYGMTVSISISDESHVNEAVEAVASLLTGLGYAPSNVLAGMQNFVYERT